MKNIPILFLLTVCLLASHNVSAQVVIAEDHASNYSVSQFENAENLGTGFGAWRRVINGDDAAITLQSAADNGANSTEINTEGIAFVLRSSLTDATNQRVDLGREFSQALQDNHTFSFNLAWNWSTPGLTGFALYNGSWEMADLVVTFDFDVEGFFLNGEQVAPAATTDDWDSGDQWRQGGEALTVEFTRNGDNLEYSVIAITERSIVDISGVVEDVNFDRVNFFNDGRPNWGAGNPGQGSLFVNSLIITENTTTSIRHDDELAQRVVLNQNYPNPFNPSTMITFDIPVASQVTLTVHDLLGRQLMTLADGVQAGGYHEVTLNAANMASGVYIYRLVVDGQTLSRKFTLAK